MSTQQYKKEVSMMKLDQLIEMREGISQVEFPIPDKELLETIRATLHRGHQRCAARVLLKNQALPNHIIPLREYRTVAGLLSP